MYYIGTNLNDAYYISHHGILGMKWGVRRYQNPDGSLTAAGRKRYGYAQAERIQKDIDSFKGLENGIRSKSGKLLLSSTDVKNSVKGLEQQRDKVLQKGEAKRAKDQKKLDAKNDPGRSSIPVIRKMGGRKINASYDVRRARGEDLVKQGRTIKGAVGRAVGRDILNNIRLGALAVSGLLAAGTATAVVMKAGGNVNATAAIGKEAVKAMLTVAGPVYLSANVIRTYQDVSDIRTYRKS